MGYTTEFQGVLKFSSEVTTKQLAALNAILGEDCRDHPDWDAKGLYHVDLNICDDFTGIQWNGAEKSYDMDKIVNVVIRQMRKSWPSFGLSGELIAQGEDVEDRWKLAIGSDGFAHKVPIKISGKKVCCPHCEREFLIEEHN